MFSVLFRTIFYSSFLQKHLISEEILMFPVKLFLQEEFAEEPHTVAQNVELTEPVHIVIFDNSSPGAFI